MTYLNYTVKDFLLDESFRKWVLEPDANAGSFWEQWLRDHPEKEREVQEAREILLLISFKEQQPDNTDEADLWEDIEKSIDEDPSFASEAGRKIISMPVRSGREDNYAPLQQGRGRVRWSGYAAAVVIFLLAGGASFFLYLRMPVKYTTSYGEVKTIVLPDNSVVKLNANSCLKYPRNWDRRSREIWLDGEAFFSVVHKSNDQKFLVHTDDVTVQVVGTEFNVNSRHIATNVVLNNGSVRLFLNHGSHKPGNEALPDLVMQPGDMVSWSSQTGKLATRKVNPELYSSWRANILVFKEAPLTEVTRSLQDNFGLNIRLEGDSIRQETYTGTIPMDNVAIFFKTLSKSLNVRIIEKDGEIYIVNK